MKSINKLIRLNSSALQSKLASLFGTVHFTKSHEWTNVESSPKKARVGITNFAQQQLGEIVHVQLPTIGKNVKSGEVAMAIESVKTAAEVYTPISGKVVAVNQELFTNPGLVNEKAESAWLFEVEYTQEPTGLLNAAEYEKLTKESH